MYIEAILTSDCSKCSMSQFFVELDLYVRMNMVISSTALAVSTGPLPTPSYRLKEVNLKGECLLGEELKWLVSDEGCNVGLHQGLVCYRLCCTVNNAKLQT